MTKGADMGRPEDWIKREPSAKALCIGTRLHRGTAGPGWGGVRGDEGA